MAILSVSQARQLAAQAGFSGRSLDIIVAIAQAESSLRTDARNVNSDGSVDRGILQINARWHPEVNDACAYNAACAFRQGYRISNSGTNFRPWSSYNSGVYLRYLSPSSGAATGSVAKGKPWYMYTESRGWDPSVPHYAIDIPMPLDTPLFFLQGPGTVKKAGYQPWGGEVYYDPDPAGGPLEYFLHLDNVFVQPGQRLKRGQIIGTSGGQTSGGDHPSSPQWSTGRHAHWGEFIEYRAGLPYGPNPDPLLDAAREGRLPIGQGGETYVDASPVQQEEKAPAPLSVKVNEILSEFPGFAGIALSLDKASQFVGPGEVWHDPGTNVKETIPTWKHFVPGYIAVEQISQFSPENYVGAAMRSVLDFVWTNSVAFLFRAMIVSIGLLLIIGLVWRAADSTGLADVIGEVATKGAMPS